MFRIAIVSLCAVLASCGASSPYQCIRDAQCVAVGGAQGVCVDSGCAFAANDCPSGYRYDQSAARPGACTPFAGVDGGADMQTGIDDGSPPPELTDLSQPAQQDAACGAGQHACAASCVDDTSTTACGASCVACAARQACVAGGCVSVANLPTARAQLAAVLGPDGRIYALGGWNTALGTLAAVDVFDAGANAWIGVAQMPTPRSAFGAVTGADGRIYAIGGAGASGIATGAVEAYSPALNKWVSVKPMLTPRSDFAAVAGQDGRLYAIGGHNAQTFYNSVEAYSPATDTWAAVAPMLTTRSELLATIASNGTIYAIGGWNGTARLDVAEAYDPALNKWTSAQAWPRPRSGAAATTGPNGRLYLIGGNTGKLGQPTVYTGFVDVFNPTAGTWATAPDMPTGRIGLAAVTGADRLVYAIGGSTSAAYSATVEAYSAASNSW